MASISEDQATKQRRARKAHKSGRTSHTSNEYPLAGDWIAEWMEELTTPVLSACKKHGTPIRVEVPESHFLSNSQDQRLWDGIKEL